MTSTTRFGHLSYAADVPAPLAMSLIALGIASQAPPTTPVTAQSPSVAFVTSSTAAVRALASDTSATVIEAGIGTALRVDQIESGWARVVVGPRVFRYDAMDADPVAIAPRSFDVRWPTGWVRTTEIGTSSPSRAAFLVTAKDAADESARRAAWMRAWSLDPHDPDVAEGASIAPAAAKRTSTRAHAIERAALVYGCAGDVARAIIVGGSLGVLGGARPPLVANDACVAHVDTRAPCAAPGAQGGGPAPSLNEHRAAMSRLRPRFGGDGPALRLEVGPGASERPLWIVARLLVPDSCIECSPTVTTADTRVARLRVPRIESGRALLHVIVPRYAGVVYDVVSGDREDVDDEPQSFELGDAFDMDPRDEPGPGEHLFAAPEACCACEDAPDEDDVAPE